MHWLADYWWVILVLFVGVILNAIKDLKRVDHKKYLQNRRELPPHRDNNAQWDDEDDWPDNKSKKSWSLLLSAAPTAGAVSAVSLLFPVSAH